MSIAFCPPNALGGLLRARREERGHTQESLVGEINVLTGFRALTVCHYSRIERGARMPSPYTLDRIADVLGLKQSERDFLFWFLPWSRPQGLMPLREVVPEEVRRVVQFHPASAYIVDRSMNILTWNDAACEIYGVELGAIEDEQDRNLAFLVFSSEPLRERLRDWETHARAVVAFCRNRWAGRENRIQDILQRMLTFPQFATWWGEFKFALQHNFPKKIDHPDVGLLVLEQTAFQVSANPNLEMILTVPLPESDTETKLREIMTRRQQRRKD